MEEKTHTVELVFLAPSKEVADALIGQLRLLTSDASPVDLRELVVNEAMGTVSSKKIISVVLSFALNVSAGVAGNAIYSALKSNPSVTCVVGETPLTKEDVAEQGKLEQIIRTAAKPASPYGTNDTRPQ